MASSASIVGRASARLPSLFRRVGSNKMLTSESSLCSSSSRSQVQQSERKISRISRLPSEVRCLVSMMPLHSAIASARLNSILSAESQSWGMIPQGLSMPL
ncbi:hypothetical protein H6P81_000648 [Aristolochia fimbriata]|uniref:Uncharacterized protein n=1 Tax=Aristolochia fimbriata TaxID=158543 RepID=A0AAV7F4Q5_ARIFI|nr:hypothetical protein H6P81_000648 [Aristolochia fimbriata]